MSMHGCNQMYEIGVAQLSQEALRTKTPEDYWGQGLHFIPSAESHFLLKNTLEIRRISKKDTAGKMGEG